MSYGMARTIPSHKKCSICMDMAYSCGCVPNCKDCYRENTVEVLQFISSFWGARAICKTQDGQFIEIDVKSLKVDG